MYEKRTAMNPFWNAFILGGVDAVTSEPFLAYVDLLGTTYSAPTLATGYGNHLAQPLLRRAMEKLGKGDEGWKEMTEEMAKKILMDSMKVLFYRDARSLNKVFSFYLSFLCGIKTVSVVGILTIDCFTT
jgi:20S proteasome subunit beta 7